MIPILTLASDGNGAAAAAVLCVFVISIGISVAICSFLAGCLRAIPPHHRKMKPGAVWCLFIPFFGIVWIFFVYSRLPASFQSYYTALGRTDVGDCGKNLGMWHCICVCCAIIPVLGLLAVLPGLVLLIMFLTRMSKLKAQMLVTGDLDIGPPLMRN